LRAANDKTGMTSSVYREYGRYWKENVIGLSFHEHSSFEVGKIECEGRGIE
jgi:hypothetical protein